MNGRMLEVTIVTGSHADKVVLIPQIKLSPDEDLFEWSPGAHRIAITINKAQGQTLSRVGVFLERACFSHGSCTLYTWRPRASGCPSASSRAAPTARPHGQHRVPRGADGFVSRSVRVGVHRVQCTDRSVTRPRVG